MTTLQVIFIVLGVCTISLLLYMINMLKQKQNENRITNTVELRAFELELRNVFDKEQSQLKLHHENTIGNLMLNFEKQINIIKEECRLQKQQEYDKGYATGLKVSNITVQIIPYKEIVKDEGIFFREEIALVGYKYQLLCNGIPCLQSHTEITEQIYLKDIKEENIRLVLDTLENIISMIPNPNVKVIGSFKDLGKELLRLKKN